MAEFAKFDEQPQIQPAQIPNLMAGGQAIIGGVEKVGTGVMTAIQKKDATDVAIAQVNIKNQVDSIAQDVTNSKNLHSDSLSDFNKKALGLINGLNASQRGMSAETRKRSNLIATTYLENARQKVFAKVDAINKNKSRAAIFQGQSDAHRDAEKLRAKGDQVSIAQADFILSTSKNSLDTALDGGAISAREYQAYNDAGAQQALTGSYTAQFSAALNKGTDAASKWMSGFLNAKHSDLSPTELQSLTGKLVQQKHQHDQAVDLFNVNIQQQINDYTASLSLGNPRNIQVETKLRASANTPADLVRINDAISYGSFTNVVKTSTPRQSNELINTLFPQKTGEGAAERLAMRSKAIGLAQKSWNDYVKDPAKVTVSDKEVIAAQNRRIESISAGVLDQGHVDTMGSDTVDNTAGNSSSMAIGSTIPLTTDPYQVMINKQRAMGLTNGQLSLIPKEDAHNAVIDINALPFGERIDRLSQTLQQYTTPQQKNIALGDLRKAGLPSSTSNAMAMNSNPDSRSSVPDYVKAQEAGSNELTKNVKDSKNIKDLDGNITTNLSSWQNSIMSFNNTSINYVNDTKQQVKLLAQYYIAKDGTSVSEAAKKASDAVVNNFYDYGSYNGHNYMHNKGTSETDINQAAETMLRKARGDALGNSLKKPTSFINPEAYALDLKQNGHVTIKNGVITLVDNTGSPVQHENGTRYEVTLDDLNNPTAQINKEIFNTLRPDVQATMMARGL